MYACKWVGSTGQTFQRRTATAMLITLAAAGACEGGPSPNDVAVCRSVQTMADHLGNGDGDAALASVDAIRHAIDGTPNETFRAEGSRFFSTLDADVDPSSMTLEQISEVGRAALAQTSGSLEGIRLECERIGSPVTLDAAAKGGEDGAGG